MKRPILVAIVGGSGSGKSCLAQQLQAVLGRRAARFSLDDFYRDRSHLSPARRARLNFDTPAAVDWKAFGRALANLSRGRKALIPAYDFGTHCRIKRPQTLTPKPILLVDGLWLLRRPAIRKMFQLSIFMDCSARTRLRRRLSRDVSDRARSRESVARQFHATVEPMHCKFVEPQRRWADVVLPEHWHTRDVQRIAHKLRTSGAAITPGVGRRTGAHATFQSVET